MATSSPRIGEARSTRTFFFLLFFNPLASARFATAATTKSSHRRGTHDAIFFFYELRAVADDPRIRMRMSATRLRAQNRTTTATTSDSYSPLRHIFHRSDPDTSLRGRATGQLSRSARSNAHLTVTRDLISIFVLEPASGTLSNLARLGRREPYNVVLRFPVNTETSSPCR